MSFFIENLAKKISHADQLPADDPDRKKGMEISNLFSSMVDFLRNFESIPNKKINALASLFWDLVGNNICPVAVTNVPTLSFWGEYQSSESLAMILLPENFLQMVKEDDVMQLGAILSAASKAKDYWNRKFVGYNETTANSDARAYTYETEMFLLCPPTWKPNSYQQKIIERFPFGLRSAPAGLHYESRPYPDTLGDLEATGPFPLDLQAIIQNNKKN